MPLAGQGRGWFVILGIEMKALGDYQATSVMYQSLFRSSDSTYSQPWQQRMPNVRISLPLWFHSSVPVNDIGATRQAFGAGPAQPYRPMGLIGQSLSPDWSREGKE